MRILGVRFRNLNSLVGEWEVDFTHPAYASDGIFAITGPTGAGKTTLMDAICLALYGSTPRLNKVTKSGNEIMSRQTGECFAEVTFETGKGRYRCHWSQHRARKKPDGELQQSRHEIVDAATGEVLESKINQVGAFIETVTGMDFGRFTQSMLLAQGEFAAFLKASANERSPILEQITGTEIYSRISIRAHERRAAEQEKLDLLQAELKGIRILGEEEERERQNLLQEKQALEADLAGKGKEMTGALAWITGIATLEKELGELEQTRQAFAERQQGFAPEAMKLERGRKALGPEGDYRAVTVLRDVQAKETGELQGALAAFPEKEKAGAAALAARAAAEGQLKEARDRQAAAGEIIKKVRDLDVRLHEQAKQLTEKNKALAEIEKQAKTCKSSVETNAQELKKVQAALEALKEYQTKHGADALLSTQFGVIERGLAGLRTMTEKYVKAQEEVSRAAGKKEAVLTALTGKDGAHEKARLAFEKKQTELKNLVETIASLLQGRDIGQWRADLDAGKERERLLVQTGETAARMDKAAVALEGLKASLDQLNARRAVIQEEVKSCGAQKQLLEKEIAGQETQVALLSRIRDLEAERKRLEDGQPCPLCGATEHPYATGNLPVLDEAESKLKELKSSFKKVSQRLSELEAGLVKITAEIRHTEKEMAEKKTALDLDEEQCAAALARLDLSAFPTERPGRICAETETARAQIAETAKLLTLAEAKTRQEKSAQAALEEARKGLDSAAKALQDTRHAMETAGLDHERLKKESADVTAELAKARAAVLEDLRPLGVITPATMDANPVIPAKAGILDMNGCRDGFSDLLKDLTERKERWQAKEAEKAAQEKKAGDLKAAIETQQALLGKLEEDLALRRRDRDGLQGEHQALRASRRELFGEKKADEEEKRLAAAVNLADAKLEKAREDHGLIEKEIGALKEKIHSLQTRIARRTTELDQGEQNLRARIQGAGFADEGDYLAARLTETERESLAAREQSLLKEKTELAARQKDKTAALACEREKKLTDQSAEALAEKIAAVDGELKRLRQDIGGIHQVLTDNEKQRRNQRERLKAIDAQRREWSRWDDLHALIGSADGKKFRNYAQGLTFQMMTAHANRRLREMTDRYLLIHDKDQPLELNVIDNYQAGEIRSTKNLSGGESFIVSLALALGLSQMASRNVRVDSLFLDEGFGTLDDDSLETALETLAGLRQDGKLIGVISHVAALKERISAQIQVIPESGGRSRLCGPGCRRI